MKREYPDSPLVGVGAVIIDDGRVLLVKRGHPFEGTMIIAGTAKQPPEYEAALAVQQRLDLERSFDYAKKTLGAGVRWKQG